MTRQNHELNVLKGYSYILTLWAKNLQGEPVEYFAKEALLMTVIEQQDKVNALSLTQEQKIDAQFASVLDAIKAQLVVNEELTQQRINSHKSGEF